MYSETIICNIALANIGQTTQIVDLATEESKAAKQCRLFYPLARDNALSDYPWTFAREVVELALLADEEDETDYNYIYAFPDDCLEPRSIVIPNIPIGLYYRYYPEFFFAGLNGNTETSAPEYLRPSFEKGVSKDKKTRTIITNCENAKLLYTRRVEETHLWTSSFAETVAWRLAAYLASPLAQSLKLGQNAMAQYNTLIQQASSQDARGENTPLYPLPESVTSRLA
jgi:hypothetical protein